MLELRLSILWTQLRSMARPMAQCAKLLGSLRAAGGCRSGGQLVIGCGRIQQGLPQRWRRDNRRQCTKTARFLAALCGRVAQFGGVPIDHDFSPKAQSTEQGRSDSAQANDVEQDFHACDLSRALQES
jgi:hypothetical protein